MNEQRQAFLDAIKADPYDTTVRKVFSDWLDENDEPEEADFFRSWTLEKHKEAEKWMEQYTEDATHQSSVWEGEKEFSMTVEQVIEAATKCLDIGERFCLPFETRDVVFTERKKFWKHFQIITGRRIAVENYDATFFRCAC